MKLRQPIFIIGLGRSGSTAFHRTFCQHPNVAWLSGLCEKYPDKPWLNKLFMEIVDYPVMGNLLQKKIMSGECYRFWEYYCKGFSTPCRDLFAEDVTVKMKEQIQNIMSVMLTNERNRLLIKITGWPRIGFLHEIFNDAKFIHIVRNEKATINSFINVDWWLGWRGPQNWGWGELTLSQKEEWEKYNRSFIALAAIQWTIFMDTLKEAKKFINETDFLEVNYEELCSSPIEIFKKVVEFCALEWSRNFEESIKRFSLRNMNFKLEKELTDHQKNIIESIVHAYLVREMSTTSQDFIQL